MACGVGACLGCVVKIKEDIGQNSFSYKRVCKEGPVFDAREILWE
jgi:dihydroorotate dehydrogenase electron transfer subunit